MSTKTRYILIGVGIILFTILAPLAILFARGFRVNLTDGEITKTGALVVKSDPKKAEVFLDNKKLKKTPLTKRFVFPGEYELLIKKPGYHEWTKTISINSQLITNPANDEREEIYLFFKNPIENLVATNTSSFLLHEDEIVSINANSEIMISSKTGSKNEFFTKIPINLSNPKIVEKNSNYILIQSQSQYFLAGNNEILPIPNNLKNLTLKGDGASVLGLNEKKSLIQYEAGSKDTKTLIDQVEAYTMTGSDIYYILDQTLYKYISTTVSTLVLDSMPDFESASIVVSPTKQIFLLLDDFLYLVNENLEKINQNVDYVNWINDSDALLYGNANEAWLYRPLSEQQNELLIRSTSAVPLPQYNSTTGYFFHSEDNTINAVEASFDGQENKLILKITEDKNVLFKLMDKGEYLIYLDAQNLISLKIR